MEEAWVSALPSYAVHKDRDIEALLAGTIGDNEESIQKVWTVVGSFLLLPETDVKAAKFWIACVRKAVKLLRGRKLNPCLAAAVLKTGMTLAGVAHLHPELSELAVRSFVDDSDVEAEDLKTFATTVVTIPRTLFAFELLKGMIGCEYPSIEEIARRAMLFADYLHNWNVKSVRELNSDYLEKRVGDGALGVLLVRHACLSLAKASVDKILPGKAEEKADVTLESLVYARYTGKMDLEEDMTLFFAKGLAGYFQENEIYQVYAAEDAFGSKKNWVVVKELFGCRPVGEISAPRSNDNKAEMSLVEEISACESPEKIMSWLMELELEQVSDNDKEKTALLWARKAQEFVKKANSMKVKKAVRFLALLSSKAIGVFNHFHNECVLKVLLDPNFQLPQSELPSEYPTRCCPFTRYAVVRSIIQYSDDMSVVDWKNTFHLLKRFLLFATMEKETNVDIISEQNKEFPLSIAKEDDIPKMSIKTAIEFSALRRLFEVITACYLTRPLGELETVKQKLNPEHFGEISPGLLVYSSLRPVPFDEVYPEDFLFLALLNQGMCVASEEKPLSHKLLMAASFLPELKREIVAQKVAAAAKLGLRRCMSLMSETEYMVLQSKCGNTAMTCALLSKPECLPMLSDKLQSHRLLKIFLSSARDEKAFDLATFDDSPESYARMIWEKLPEGAQAIEELLITLWKRANQLVFQEDDFKTYAQRFLSGAYSRQREGTRYIRTPQGFLTDVFMDKAQLIMSAIVKVLEHAENISGLSVDTALLTDFWLHKSASSKLRELADPPSPEREAFWQICAYSEGCDRGFAKWDQPVTKLVFHHFLNEGNTSVVESLLPKKVDDVSKCGLGVILDALWTTSKKSEDLLIGALVKTCDHGVLSNMIWSFLVSPRPDLAVKLFKGMEMTGELAVRIIDAIPDTFSFTDVSDPFVTIFGELSDHLSKHQMACPTSESEESMSWTNWPEDPEKQAAHKCDSSGVNIWEGRQVEMKCSKTSKGKRIGFVCYDCGQCRDYICLSCAMNCHRGHKVAFAKICDYTCQCSSICECGKVPTKQETVTATANPQKLSKVFTCLANAMQSPCKPEEKSSLSPRLGSADIKTMPLGLRVEQMAGRVRFKRTRKQVVDVNYLRQELPRGMREILRERASDTPPQLCDYADGLVFIAQSSNVLIYNSEDFTKIGQLSVGSLPFFIKAQKQGDRGTLVAVACWTALKVFERRTNGSFELVCSTDHSLASQRSIVLIDWIDGNLLGVLWQSKLEIYDTSNPDGNFTAVETVERGSGQRFTSVVFCKKDDLNCALLIDDSGKAALEPLGVSPGTRTARNSIPWPTRYSSPIISACPEANMLFLTAPAISLQVMRFSEILNGELSRPINVSFERGVCEMKFCCSYPGCPSIQMFIQPSTNSLFAAEFTDSRVEVRNLVRGFSSFSYADREMRTYGWFKTEKGIYCIDTTGTICELVERTASDNDGSDIVINDFGPEYRVPPTFWADADIATTENSEITGTDDSQNYNTLYRNDIAFFHSSVPRKVLTYHVSDPTLCIVGIMLWFGDYERSNRPDYVVLNGRKYDTSEMQHYMFPLKPSEVRPGKQVDLFFPNSTRVPGPDYHLQGSVIFTKKLSEIAPFIECAKPKSTNPPKDLFEFSEASISAVTEKQAILQKWMFCLPPSQVPADPEVLRRLITIMYSSAELAGPIRGALVRLATPNRQDVAHLWADTMTDVLARRAVHPNNWQRLWEDYMLFDSDNRDRVPIWESDPKIGLVGSVCSAFTIDE